MNKKTFKRLPYGTSDFGRIITENYAYVDKTRYIEMLEKEPNPSQFFIRPRKFGKSLFFSMLSYYYDINCADKFDQLFGELYIGKHPTPEKNSYLMLAFDFSAIDTSSAERFRISFNRNIESSVRIFFSSYACLFAGAKELLQKMIDNESQMGTEALNLAFETALNANKKIHVIIDEYDHFANDLIAMGTLAGKDFYKDMVAANGLVRDFYERLKIATKSSIVNRTFITGISPVMLDDLTSGYNIANILTLNIRYNEMMGFTQEEVNALMEETGVDPALINVDMELYYNGYLFHKDGANRVYNPSMILYFFHQIVDSGKVPENIIDLNLQTDYGRLQRLTRNEKNRNTLIQIVKDEGVVAEILQKFSIDRMNDDDYFISLMFYMGLLTIKEPHLSQQRLGIPNYSIKTIYWEYIKRLLRDTSPETSIETRILDESIFALAMEGDVHRFIAYVSEHAFSKLSDYDLQRFDEKYIQILLLAYLFMSKVYVPMSEYEAVPGRTDIYLQRNPLYPEIKYEWLFELKYCKSDAKEDEITAKRNEGLAQLEQYTHSHRLGNRPDLKAAVIVFIGKNKYEIIEHSYIKSLI
jgi:hypothetical protein